MTLSRMLWDLAMIPAVILGALANDAWHAWKRRRDRQRRRVR